MIGVTLRMPNNTDQEYISSIRTLIQLHFNEFNGGERRVAEYLLGISGDINQSITSLAMDIGASEATIIRLCKKLGLSGFSELKLRLAKESGASDHAMHREFIDVPIQSDDTIESLPGKIIAGAITGLRDMGNALRTDMLQAAIKALIDARRIVLFGVANSAVVCRDLQCKLLRLGFSCETYDDSHQQLSAAYSLKKGDVAVAVSHSGLTIDTIDAAQIARQHEATVICISNCLDTPLISISDIKLLTGGHEVTFNSETMASRISQLAIIDMLYIGIILTDYDKYTGQLAAINRALKEKAY